MSDQPDENTALLTSTSTTTSGPGAPSRPPYIRTISNRPPSIASTPSFRPSSPAIPVPERGKLKPKALSYMSYYLPALDWIPQYKLSALPGDVAAGITLASFQIPIVMSYATSLAHVSTVCGLYGLVVPTFVYAIMGTVPNMVVGPEAAISLVVGQATAPYLHNDKLTPDVLSGVMAGTGGAVLLLGGLLRFGFLDSVLSRALLRGFISGVGVVMVIEQLPSELGILEKMHEAIGTHPSVVGKFLFVLNNWHQAHRLTALVGFTSIIVIIVGRLIKGKFMHKYPKIIFLPEILLTVVIATILTNIFDLDESGLIVVGKIKPGKVSISFPVTSTTYEVFKDTFGTSFFCAILGFFESTIASKSLAAMADLSVSTNRELVALGACNIFGSLVCALPSFGGYGRSKINALSGATTQMSGFVLCGVTIFSITFLMPYFYYLPECVLSAVISVVGLSLLEEAPKDIKFYWQIGGYEDLFTLFLTLTCTIFFSVESGIAVGVGFSIVRVIHHATRPRIQILGRVPGTNIFENADKLQLEEIEGCLIVKIPEPLTFANTGDLRNRLRRFEVYGTMNVHPSYPRIRQEEMTQYLIVDMHGMTECDSAAAQILLEIVESYVKKRCVPVLFTRLSKSNKLRKMFKLAGITDLLTKPGDGKVSFPSVDEALVYVDHNSDSSSAREV